MNNQVLFVIILCGLLNSSSFILSSGRPPLPTPPQPSQKQLQQIQQQIEQQKQQEALETAQKKTEQNAASDNLFAHYSCLSERQKSKDPIPQAKELRRDGSLDEFDRPKTTASSQNEAPLNLTQARFSPTSNSSADRINKLIVNPVYTDTFLINPTSSRDNKNHYSLTEENMRTLIDIFKKVPDYPMVYITMSLSNPQKDTLSTSLEKTFSITKSVLDNVNQRLLTPGIESNQKLITDFCEQLNSLTTNGKKSPSSSNAAPILKIENDEQKQRRLEMKSAALEVKKLLGQEIADDTVTQQTTIAPEQSTNTPSFSFYRSRLFWGSACTVGVLAVAIAAFYYLRTGHFLELCKNFFTSSTSQNIVSPTEPLNIEVNAVQI